MSAPLLRSDVPDYPCRRGKVRDVYDLGDRLAIVATDRISAFDWVLPNGIPDKGRILNALTLHWFARVSVPNHFLANDLNQIGPAFADRAGLLQGRTMLVKKAAVVPFECVVRGYLAGSGWKEYRESGAVCGVALPARLRESDRLPEAIFTPATKAETGHDVNVTFATMANAIGHETAEELRKRSLDVYRQAAAVAAASRIIVADTKFEWGRDKDGKLILIDEVLTPDSSRFWPADLWQPGGRPPSFDKQFVRDWLDGCGWDKNSPPPPLPDDVVEKTRAKYVEAFQRLTGIPWLD